LVGIVTPTSAPAFDPLDEVASTLLVLDPQAASPSVSVVAAAADATRLRNLIALLAMHVDVRVRPRAQPGDRGRGVSRTRHPAGARQGLMGPIPTARGRLPENC
jgi:hypothetical protein